METIYIAQVEFDTEELAAYVGPTRLAFSTEREALDFLVYIAMERDDLDDRMTHTMETPFNSGNVVVDWVGHDTLSRMVGIVYPVPAMGTLAR